MTLERPSILGGIIVLRRKGRDIFNRVRCCVQWTPGGKGAHALLEKFVADRLRNFSKQRAKTDRESTSTLSPHVHFGEISNRHIYYVVRPLSVSFLWRQ